MSEAEEFKFSLKVLINQQKTKVLFAEANGDFLDVLLNFLMLPLGKLVIVLEKHYGGSLTTLYNGIANPNNAQLWTELGKQVLLNPRSSLENALCNLKVNCDYTLHMNYDFGKPYDGVFTKSTASFVICDDLFVVPSVRVRVSVLETLRYIGITMTNLDGTEIRNVTVGFNEIMDLLKGSLISRTPLYDLILDKRQMDFATLEYEPITLWDLIEIREITFDFKMILTVTIQKSTNNLLFSQTKDDFMDFLFSILTIPLGRVEIVLRI